MKRVKHEREKKTVDRAIYNDDEPDERMGLEKDLDAPDAAVNNYH